MTDLPVFPRSKTEMLGERLARATTRPGSSGTRRIFESNPALGPTVMEFITRFARRSRKLPSRSSCSLQFAPLPESSPRTVRGSDGHTMV